MYDRVLTLESWSSNRKMISSGSKHPHLGTNCKAGNFQFLYFSLLTGNLAEKSSRETASSAILRQGFRWQAIQGFASLPSPIIRLDRYCKSFCALVPFRTDFRLRHFCKSLPAVLLRSGDRGKS